MAVVVVAANRMTMYWSPGMLSVLIITLFFFPAVTRSRQQDNFYFDPSPVDQEVIEGQEARLRCDVSNRKHIRFSWNYNGKTLQNTSRRFQEERDLRILRVSRLEDAGVFQCIATNMTTGLSVMSRSATLTVRCKY